VRIRIVVISVVAALASLAVVPAASAEPPEFGRCLKQATKALTNFDSARCVKRANEDAGTEEEQLKKGNYGWFPGVVKRQFTTALAPSTLATFETVTANKLVCTGQTGIGEYMNSKQVGKVVFKLTGCESGSLKCESAGGGSGDVTTASLAGTLGFETITEDQPVRDRLALELHAEGGGDIAQFSCGGLAHRIGGSFMRRLAANAMKLSATDKFTESKGRQKPDHFAGGVPGQHVLEWDNAGGPFEQAGLAMAETTTNEEKVEASTVDCLCAEPE